MLKKILLLVLFFQVLATFASVRKENDFGPKNLLETGLTGLNFFNGQGLILSHPGFNAYVSYTRVLSRQHLFIMADHQFNSIGFNAPSDARDFVRESTSRVTRLALGKVWQYKRWRFSPYLSVDYRKGYGDYVVAYSNFWEPPTAVNHYKSFGTGVGASINYRIARRWTLGFESHMDYFFQKNNLMDYAGNNVAEQFSAYRPNRLMSFSHLKIGFMF